MDLASMGAVPNPLPWPKTTMPIDVFRGIHWAGFGLCVIAVSCRIYIRLVTFRHLVFEDSLILVSLACLLVTSILCHLRMADIYNKMEVAWGNVLPAPDFWDRNKEGLDAVLAHLVLTIVALFLVKLNFLLFFRRLGSSLTHYQVIWWTVTIITVACGATTLGLTRFKCIQGTPDYILTYCTSPQELTDSSRANMISSILDVVSDVLIMALPIFLIWKVRLTTRKKVVLSIGFCISLVTVGLTIARGAFYHEVNQDTVNKSLNVAWIWFWYSMELITAIIIACLVSFRALFTQKMNSKASAEQRAAHIKQRKSYSNLKGRVKALHDTLLETFKSLEGSTTVGRDDVFILSEPPSGLMTVDFSTDEGWRKALPHSNYDGSDSVRTLTRGRDA